MNDSAGDEAHGVMDDGSCEGNGGDDGQPHRPNPLSLCSGMSRAGVIAQLEMLDRLKDDVNASNGPDNDGGELQQRLNDHDSAQDAAASLCVGAIEKGPFISLIRTNSRRDGGGVDQPDLLLVNIAKRLMNASTKFGMRDRESGLVSNDRKAKSLFGRWMSGSSAAMSVCPDSEFIDEEGNAVLKRNFIFEYSGVDGDGDRKSYRIVNVFRKKARKWLIHIEGDATTDTRVHAQLLYWDNITDSYIIETGLDRRRDAHMFVTLDGSQVGFCKGRLASPEEDRA